MKRTLFLSILLLVLAMQTSWGQIPQTIGYQGVLTNTNGTPVPDGVYNLTFKLYADAVGGPFLWPETQAVSVSKGIFNVILGEVNPLDDLAFDKQYWLGVTVGDGLELTPRIKLTASPYSLNAPGGDSVWLTSGDNIYRLIGNVGIGTTSPGNKLDVNGGVQGSYFIAAGDQSLFYRGSWIDPHSGIPYDAKFGGSGNGIAVQGQSIFNGNVGIGTTNPGSYKLAVEGKIGAREVVVTLDNWSDFVFKKDYRLMPLHEVEQHIQQNQRLPDIPSEKEVLENGVSLGEMQSKLLQKVEELTLYVIEQNKRIERLEKENEVLKGRVASLEETK